MNVKGSGPWRAPSSSVRAPRAAGNWWRAGVAGGGKGGVMPGTGRLEYWRRAYERQRAGLDPWGT